MTGHESTCAGGRAAALLIALVGALVALAVPAAARAESAAAATTRDYVALGDSFASGLGTGRYDPNSGACKRSPYAYTRLWAASHRVNSFRSVACAGAVTANVRSSQVLALNSGTDFVTISIGGNDVGFERVMTTCRTELTSDNHCLYEIDKSNAVIRTQLAGRLDATFRAIRVRAPRAQVWVVGYARLFTETSFCGLLSMSNLKRHRLNQSANLLNDVMRARTVAAGYRYVDTRAAFANNGLCSARPWINGPNVFNVTESYHPNLEGHRLGLLRALTRVSG